MCRHLLRGQRRGPGHRSLGWPKAMCWPQKNPSANPLQAALRCGRAACCSATAAIDPNRSPGRAAEPLRLEPDVSSDPAHHRLPPLLDRSPHGRHVLLVRVVRSRGRKRCTPRSNGRRGGHRSTHGDHYRGRRTADGPDFRPRHARSERTRDHRRDAPTDCARPRGHGRTRRAARVPPGRGGSQAEADSGCRAGSCGRAAEASPASCTAGVGSAKSSGHRCHRGGCSANHGGSPPGGTRAPSGVSGRGAACRPGTCDWAHGRGKQHEGGRGSAGLLAARDDGGTAGHADGG